MEIVPGMQYSENTNGLWKNYVKCYVKSYAGDSITTLVTVFAAHLCSLTQESMKAWALSNNKKYTLKMRENNLKKE